MKNRFRNDTFKEAFSAVSSSCSKLFYERNPVIFFAGLTIVLALSFLLYAILGSMLPQAITRVTTAIVFFLSFIIFLAYTDDNFQILSSKIGLSLLRWHYRSPSRPAFTRLAIVFITFLVLTAGYIIYFSEANYLHICLILVVSFCVGEYLTLGTLLDRPASIIVRWHLPTFVMCNIFVPIVSLVILLVLTYDLDLTMVSFGGLGLGVSLASLLFSYRQAVTHARDVYLADSYDDSDISRVSKMKSGNRVQRKLARHILVCLKAGNIACATALSAPLNLSMPTHRSRNRIYYEINCKLDYRLKRYEKAVALATIGQEYLSRKGERPSLGLINVEARSLFALGRVEDARSKLEKAVKRYPHYPYFWLSLATIHWHIDKLDEAEDMNDQVLKIDSNCPLALRNKALFLTERLVLQHRENPGTLRKNLSTPVGYIEKAKQVSEDRYNSVAPTITDTFGYIEVLRGNYKKGIGYLLDALLTESHNDSRFHLALVFMIGAPTYLRAEYQFRRILSNLAINRQNRIYKLAQKNLENRIKVARLRSTVFNENVLFHPFLKDKDFPPEAIVKTPDELSEICEFQQKKILSHNLLAFYQSKA